MLRYGIRSGDESTPVFNLNSFDIVFWDFDGVIKESVDIKTQAYVALFQSNQPEIVERIRQHHEANGGVSRFDKIPIYLEWAGMACTEARIEEYCDKFSQMVIQKVIESPWVPGVEKILRSRNKKQKYVVISATPQNELYQILTALNLVDCFSAIFGAPRKKIDVIKETLRAESLNPDACVMIGDATTDLDAAIANKIYFLLRKYNGNRNQFPDYAGAYIEDFLTL